MSNDPIEDAAQTFDELCRQRHEKGMLEYGQFTFLENDVVRMMLEELADTTNYCRMQGIKLLLLQTILEEELEQKLGKGEQKDSITIGIKSFKGTGEGWGE